MTRNDTRGLWRGKRVDNGEWVEGQFIPSNTNDGYRTYIIANAKWDNSDDGLDLLETDIYEVDPSTLGECTGLRDRNGKLVFEGDIISFMESTEKYYVTKWDKENACFYFDRDVYVKACCVSQHGIIVGNIHDNSELLKGADKP